MLLVAVLVASCHRKANAQVEVADDPVGPIRCFGIAEDEELAEQTAVELCTGATSDAPGQCYAAALDRVPGLSSQQIVQLCRFTTSLAPLECYERLEAIGTITNQQAVAYCATTCALGPVPPQSSDPNCVASANERTDLALQTIAELCFNSRSAAPVDCLVVGEDETNLDDLQLVQLCRHTFSCQYYNAPPAQ